MAISSRVSQPTTTLRKILAAVTAVALIQLAIDAKAAETSAFPVPLSITEDAGIARFDEPVTWGVPVAEAAAVTDVTTLRIVDVDAGGTDVPAQFTVLARWNGSPHDTSLPIRWVLVDIQVSIDADETRNFRLETADAETPADAMPTTETADSFTIETGAATFTLDKTSFNFLDGARIDTDQDGTPDTDLVIPGHNGGVIITPLGKDAYYAALDPGAAPTVQVVLAGPLRTVVRLTGRLNSNSDNDVIAGQLNYFEYTAYYHFYAGHDHTRVQFSIRYPEKNVSGDQHAGGTPLFHEFDSFVMRLPVEMGSDREVRIATDVDDTTGEVAFWEGTIRAGETARVYQDSSGFGNWAAPAGESNNPMLATTFQGYRVFAGTGPVPTDTVDTGNQALGYCDAHDGTVGVLAGLRYFWQSFPKGIRLQDGMVVFELFPGEWRTEHQFRGGLQKTHDMLVAFHTEAGDSAEVRATQEGFHNPLRLVAPATIYRDSMAIGPMAVEDKSMFWHYDTGAEAVIDYTNGVYNQGDIYDERADDDCYGWMNFGDTYRAGYKGSSSRYWGNNELDFSFCMMRSFFRDLEHDKRFLENAAIMAQHLYDIDMYHTDRDIWWANRGIRKHDASGVQDHRRAPNLSHHWLQGMKSYYWFTGDPFARTFLLDAGIWLTNLEDPNDPGEIAFSGEIRSKGWLLQSFVDLFEFTGNEAYLDICERMIPKIILDVLQPGGYIVNSDHLVTPWQMSYITEGLGRYLLTLRELGQENAQALEALTRILGFLENDAWMPDENRIAYYWDPYTQEPLDYNYNITQTSVDGFIYGYRLTGWIGYLDMARLTYDAVHATQNYPYYYSNTIATAAKNAGFLLRFGQAEMWHRQTLAEDTGAPTIASCTLSSLGSNECTVAIDTDEPTARVLFVWAQGEPMILRKNLAYYRESHDIFVPNLKSATDYEMVAMMIDLAGNVTWSDVEQFHTPFVSLAPGEGSGGGMGNGGRD